ncbi:unnamed protein product [Chondrus crispus]|uniref:Uncharacterized protein n=1 Tax=Chondrus crispus TaxID=2769 RepID=R7QQ32_CHOCR|nr:unnamed protein product [Chondrus crispus]CDF40229.1 unnamed protein product [Chondrus crispus]|eukprot:XP_005710523.1 unnamed protein product [Chondrus crispus]
MGCCSLPWALTNSLGCLGCICCRESESVMMGNRQMGWCLLKRGEGEMQWLR